MSNTHIHRLRLLLARTMKQGTIRCLSLGVVRPNSLENSRVASSLHGHGFAHDGAAACKHLQVGHAATTGRGCVSADESSARGKRAQGGRRCLLQEGAYAAGFTEKCLHGLGKRSIGCSVLWVVCRIEKFCGGYKERRNVGRNRGSVTISKERR